MKDVIPSLKETSVSQVCKSVCPIYCCPRYSNLQLPEVSRKLNTHLSILSQINMVLDWIKVNANTRTAFPFTIVQLIASIGNMYTSQKGQVGVGKTIFLASQEYGRHKSRIYMSTATSNDSMKGYSMNKVVCINPMAKQTFLSGISTLNLLICLELCSV